MDCSVLAFDAVGMLVDACYYNRLDAFSGGLHHSGDNRDGVQDGIDESIIITSSKLPPGISFLIFSVNAYSGGNFADVETARTTIRDATGTEIANMSASCTGADAGRSCLILSIFQVSVLYYNS